MADSSIVSHPQRVQIDAMILGGLSLRKIAQSVSPAVSPAALFRYKTGETPKQRRETAETTIVKLNTISSLKTSGTAEQCATIPPSDTPQARPRPLLERAEKLYQRIDKAMDAGETAVTVDKDGNTVGADLRVLPPLFREANNSLRLLGELTGELNQAAAQAASITINIVQSAPEPTSTAYDLEVTAQPLEIASEPG